MNIVKNRAVCSKNHNAFKKHFTFKGKVNEAGNTAPISIPRTYSHACLNLFLDSKESMRFSHFQISMQYEGAVYAVSLEFLYSVETL